MKKNIWILFFPVLLLAVFCHQALAYAALAIVVHPSNPLMALESDQVKRLFLAKAHNFSDGSFATPVDQAEGSPSRFEFYEKVVNKSPQEERIYWSNIIFTGGGTPPLRLEDDLAVKKYISTHADAIGYIRESTIDAQIKVVLRIP